MTPRVLAESAARVSACIRRDPGLQSTPAFIRWAAARTRQHLSSEDH